MARVGTNHDGSTIYQNLRASSVFKDGSGAYWGEGIVFWEWYTDDTVDDGKPFKSYFTSSDSKVPITEWPWTLPDSPEYRERLPDGKV